LINFQTGYMKLDKQELYDKKGKYVGCGPGTARSLNSAYKLLNNSNVPEQAKNGIMGMGKSKENNSTYNWDIKAGVYNAYVKEAQLMLMNMGYKLPKYGADGKWSNSGETYEALLGFQKGCETKLGGVKKNGTDENRNEVEHFQSIEPTGKLDQRTYDALQKEKTKRVTASYNNTHPNKVENGNKGTGKDNTFDFNLLFDTNYLSKLNPEERADFFAKAYVKSDNGVIKGIAFTQAFLNKPWLYIYYVRTSLKFVAKLSAPYPNSYNEFVNKFEDAIIDMYTYGELPGAIFGGAYAALKNLSRGEVIFGEGFGNAAKGGRKGLKAGDATPGGYKLTNHAVENANKRGFTGEKIDNTISNHSQKVYQPGGQTVYAKKNGNYYDVVIVNKNNEVITVVGGNTNSLKTWNDVTKMLNNNGGYSSLPID